MRRVLAPLAIAPLLLAMIASTLVVGTADASVSPLSPVPVVTLACTNGVSTVTIDWGAGSYGVWEMQHPLQPLSGGPATYATPTTQTFTVGAGWYPQTATVRLNQDPLDTASGDNQTHPDIVGSTCPFDPGIAISTDCAAHTISITVQQGRVDFWQATDGATIFLNDYFSHPVGPTVIGPIAIPAAVTDLLIDVGVNGVVSSFSYTLDCNRFCVHHRSWWYSVASNPYWPTTPITLGSVSYTMAQAKPLIAVAYGGGSYAHLLGSLLTAKLNVSRGANMTGLSARIAEADAFLTTYPVGTALTSAQRSLIVSWASWFDDFAAGRNGGPAPCGPNCF